MLKFPKKKKVKGKHKSRDEWGLKEWIRECDKVFSMYVRKSRSGSNGEVQCCTCSRWKHWKGLDNGHFMSRRYTAVRWDERNCGPQCTHCNTFSQGNQAAFAE